MNDIIVSENDLRAFTTCVFLEMGCSDTHAILAADVLIRSDLRGIDSHGVARLSGYYRLWKKGRINTRPNIQVVRELATTATVDGDGGLGLVVAPFAMQLAAEKADKFGSGWVAVKNSNHFGIAGYHALLAVARGMIGISMTNASPLVAPTFSSERMLGTNPMCYAFPAGKYPPVVVDMATASVANGKLEIAERAGKSVPEGWVQTAAGNITTAADALKKGGSLLPLGSDKEHGSHKGYGLGATVDILSAVLSGANYGPWVPPFVAFLDPAANPVGDGIGHFFGAMRVDGFRPIEEFTNHMDNWISTFKAATPSSPDQPVIIPGEPEFFSEKSRAIDGIPVVGPVFDDLQNLAGLLGIEKLSSSGQQ